MVLVRSVLRQQSTGQGIIQATELLDLQCQWHGRYGGCGPKGYPNACPPGVDPLGEAGHKPNSWDCDVTFQNVSWLSAGPDYFKVPTQHNRLGYLPAESWFGKSQISFHPHKFTIDPVESVAFPGRLTLTCLKPLAEALKAGGSAEGCTVRLENHYTANTLQGTCSGTYTVPNVMIAKP